MTIGVSLFIAVMESGGALRILEALFVRRDPETGGRPLPASCR
jgi:hypothetical protein